MSQELVKMCLKKEGPASLPHAFAHWNDPNCTLLYQASAIASCHWPCYLWPTTLPLEEKAKMEKGKVYQLVRRGCKPKANWKARVTLRVRGETGGETASGIWLSMLWSGQGAEEAGNLKCNHIGNKWSSLSSDSSPSWSSPTPRYAAGTFRGLERHTKSQPSCMERGKGKKWSFGISNLGVKQTIFMV